MNVEINSNSVVVSRCETLKLYLYLSPITTKNLTVEEFYILLSETLETWQTHVEKRAIYNFVKVVTK